MERPWSYYLLLIAAWLAGLWGLWLIGEGWVNWPLDGPGPVRDAVRGRMWTGAVLLGAAVGFGGLASVVRLLQDGVAALASVASRSPVTGPAPLPETTAIAPAAAPPPLRVVAPVQRGEPATEPARLVVGGAAEPSLDPVRREPPREAARGDGPRLDASRRDDPRRASDDPPGRREPKLVPDA